MKDFDAFFDEWISKLDKVAAASGNGNHGAGHNGGCSAPEESGLSAAAFNGTQCENGADGGSMPPSQSIAGVSAPEFSGRLCDFDKTTGRWPVIVGSDGEGAALRSSQPLGWTEAHERVFGIKQVSGGNLQDKAASYKQACSERGHASPAPTYPSGIHLVPDRPPLLNAHEPETCACGEPMFLRCKDCDAPLCAGHSYKSDSGPVCGDCSQIQVYEAYLAKMGGRADAR